jgi:PAS domain S-box-containing protein/TyrR family helix-turn-helix protein
MTNLKQQTDAALIIPLILDCIQVGVVAINHQGIVIFCNAEAKKMMGFKGEVIGRPIDTVLLNTGLTDVIKSGQAKYGEDYYLGKKRFKNNLSPIMNDGIAVGAVATFSYFTESVDISTELESFMKINQELEGIISSSYDGIIITDGDGIVLKVNDANQRATNLNAEDFLGRKIDSLYENGLFSNEPIAKQARMKKEIVTGLNRINTGKEVMVTSTPVLDEAGNVIRVVTNVRDMSDIISLQEQLNRSQEISNCLRSESNKALVEELHSHEVITKSPLMLKILELTRRVAGSAATVLLQGESGVGKEVFAKLLHAWSQRQGAFIKINCSAIPGHLLESELFGYAQGAFTGANREGKPGLFELADEGTLFLDEIEDLPLILQGKFLRVLQDQEFIRIGGTKVIKVNVRLIAASNQDLIEMVNEKKFRQDLFYRLNVVPIHIPPLRERPEDIPLLTEHFLTKFNRKYNLNKTLSPQLIQDFYSNTWPGNIRELINTLERLIITSPENVLRENPVNQANNSAAYAEKEVGEAGSFRTLKEALAESERDILVKTLEKHKSARLAGKVLGISHTAVLKKIKKYGL